MKSIKTLINLILKVTQYHNCRMFKPKVVYRRIKDKLNEKLQEIMYRLLINKCILKPKEHCNFDIVEVVCETLKFEYYILK